MVFRRDSSPQTRAVLATLLASQGWRHGYDIARRAGLASGTLYPILGRLADRGLLETRWEDDPPEGRPRRHLYRLTAAGAELAAAAAQQPGAPDGAQPSPPGRRDLGAGLVAEASSVPPGRQRRAWLVPSWAPGRTAC